MITDADPDNTGPDPSEWPTYVVRDSAGMVTDISTPANVTAYTHSSASFTTSSSVGLVTSYVRESSGVTKYYLLDRKWKAGTSGTAYLDGCNRPAKCFCPRRQSDARISAIEAIDARSSRSGTSMRIVAA